MKERTNRILVTVLIVAGILALTWILRDVVHRLRAEEPCHVPVQPPPAPLNLVENETVKANANPIHKGGIKDVAALRLLIQQDPPIAQHYKDAGFDINCASDAILATNMWATVSYRIGATFSYTHAPVLLLGGEKIIVDNCHAGVMIRSKCANIILTSEKHPVSPTDTPLGSLIPSADLSPADFVLPAVLPTSPTPPIPPIPPLPPIPPVLPPTGTQWYPVPCCLVPFAPPNTPPIRTPQPNTGFLLISGWTCILVLYRVIRGRNLGRKS